MKTTWIISALLANMSFSEAMDTQLLKDHAHGQQRSSQHFSHSSMNPHMRSSMMNTRMQPHERHEFIRAEPEKVPAAVIKDPIDDSSDSSAEGNASVGSANLVEEDSDSEEGEFFAHPHSQQVGGYQVAQQEAEEQDSASESESQSSESGEEPEDVDSPQAGKKKKFKHTYGFGQQEAVSEVDEAGINHQKSNKKMEHKNKT